MKTGLVSVTFRNRSVEEVLALCRKNRAETIEWGGDVHVPAGAYGTAARVARKTRDSGVELVSYGSYYRVGEKQDKPFEVIVKTAQCLDSPCIRVWAGAVSSRTAEEAYFQRVEEELREISRLADREGIRIALEYHRNTLTEDWKSALRLVEETGAPNLYLYWQPNPDISHEERMAELEHLRERICSVHTFYWEKGNIRKPLSDGAAAWREYAEILGGKEIPFMIEFVKEDSEKQFGEDMESLRRILVKVPDYKR